MDISAWCCQNTSLLSFNACRLIFIRLLVISDVIIVFSWSLTLTYLILLSIGLPATDLLKEWMFRVLKFSLSFNTLHLFIFFSSFFFFQLAGFNSWVLRQKVRVLIMNFTYFLVHVLSSVHCLLSNAVSAFCKLCFVFVMTELHTCYLSIELLWLVGCLFI